MNVRQGKSVIDTCKTR